MRIRTKCHNFDLSPDAKDIVAELTDGSQEEKPMESTSPADTVMTTTTPKTDGGSYDVGLDLHFASHFCYLEQDMLEYFRSLYCEYHDMNDVSKFQAK